MDAATAERLKGKTVVLSLSGGKDSTATELHLREQGVQTIRVNMDTGWELWWLYHYLHPHDVAVEKIQTIYPMWSRAQIEARLAQLDIEYQGDAPLERALGPIVRIRGPKTMRELYLDKAMFPHGKGRWCTPELKTKPMSAFIAALQDSTRVIRLPESETGEYFYRVLRDDWETPREFWVNAYGHEMIQRSRKDAEPWEVVNAVGIRDEESAARKDMPEWEWSNEMDCDVWRPIKAFTTEDVILIHQRHAVRPCKLYLMGMERVGCGPCIKERKAGIRIIAEKDPDRIALLRQDEATVSEAARARVAEQGKEHIGDPAFFQIKEGRTGVCWPIDKAVEWSRTEFRGRGQFLMGEIFDMDMADQGCSRWGLCDAGPAR
jgi:3'-phosphoadenosine 5'-phosphosulfate sulfotransferase (PAPS reductase)/FAD synthetase